MVKINRKHFQNISKYHQKVLVTFLIFTLTVVTGCNPLESYYVTVVKDTVLNEYSSQKTLGQAFENNEDWNTTWKAVKTNDGDINVIATRVCSDSGKILRLYYISYDINSPSADEEYIKSRENYAREEIAGYTAELHFNFFLSKDLKYVSYKGVSVSFSHKRLAHLKKELKKLVYERKDYDEKDMLKNIDNLKLLTVPEDFILNSKNELERVYRSSN